MIILPIDYFSPLSRWYGYLTFHHYIDHLSDFTVIAIVISIATIFYSALLESKKLRAISIGIILFNLCFIFGISMFRNLDQNPDSYYVKSQFLDFDKTNVTVHLKQDSLQGHITLNNYGTKLVKIMWLTPDKLVLVPNNNQGKALLKVAQYINKFDPTDTSYTAIHVGVNATTAYVYTNKYKYQAIIHHDNPNQLIIRKEATH